MDYVNEPPADSIEIVSSIVIERATPDPWAGLDFPCGYSSYTYCVTYGPSKWSSILDDDEDGA